MKGIFTKVSINISKEFRKLGYGSKILKKSEKFLKRKVVIISIIKKKNLASIKIFKKNNYKILNNNKDLILVKIT